MREHLTELREYHLPKLRAATPGSAPKEDTDAALLALRAVFDDNLKLHSEVYGLPEAELQELREVSREVLAAIGEAGIRAFDAKKVRTEVRMGWLAMIGEITRSPIALLERENARGRLRVAFYSTSGDVEVALVSAHGTARIAGVKIRSVEFLREQRLYEHIVVVTGFDRKRDRFVTRTPGFAFTDDGAVIDDGTVGKGKRSRLGLRARLRYSLALRLAQATGYSRRFRNAWVLADRREQANDNAEVLYRHLKDERPDINAWFALAKHVPAYRQLKAEGFKLVPYGSLRHFVLMKHASRLVSSQIDKTSMQPFPPSVLSVRWPFTYLKHGVVHTEHFRRYNAKSIDLVVTATPDEDQALAGDRGGYRFTRDEVELTGMPRHDRLMRAFRNADSQGRARTRLLIMPTWRIYLGRKNPDLTWSVVDDFSDSSFVRQWSAFINSPTLRQACEEAGLEAVFLMHPRFAPHAHYFGVPQWMSTATYQEDIAGLLASTRVAVTDYSSQAFEAAFVGAPTVYLQFDREEFFGGGHSSQLGEYDYASQGFGPVVDDAEAASSAVVQLLDGEHPEQEVFAERIASLYAFRDAGACARVTAAIERLG